MTKEQKFYNALKDIFVGAKVEGESGYINLIWKTHMLYYVKTDRLFKNLEVEIEGQNAKGKAQKYKFFFDVSALEHKKANEKKEIIFELKEKRKDGEDG